MSQPAKDVKSTTPSPTPPAPATPTPSSAPAMRLGPDHRDIYLIIIGILVGVLASPGVLGKLSPRVYDWLIFDGKGQAYTELRTDLQKKLQEIIGTGASAAASDKVQAEISRITTEFDAARNEYSGRMSAILLAIAALMVLDAMIDPASATGLGRRRGQLATARYALLALWLAMLLAEPSSLRYVADNLLFVVLLIALGLSFALVPLGWLKPKKA